MNSINIKEKQNKILYINFNQDITCIGIGTDEGYLIYNVKPLKEIYSKSNLK